jgi:NADH-quinone oxidoreductase subunit N
MAPLLGQDTIPTPPIDWLAILPWVVMSGTALLVLVMVAVRRLASTTWYAAVSVLGAGASGVSAVVLWTRLDADGSRFAFSGMVAADGFAAFLMLTVAVATVLGVLLADEYLKREGIDRAEYYILILFSAAGMQLMASANNLITVFLALELLSVCLYLLAAWRSDDTKSQEAGAKYLLLGAFASAVFLYGIAMLYGGTGTTNLATMAQFFSENVQTNQGLVYLGMGLVVVGLGFKIAAVPFHMWTPDVYQGSPALVVAFMASGAKIAGFAGLFRVLQTGLAVFDLDWQPLLWGLAIVTMIGGSAMAIVQTDVKRMLAYSSIAHAGFILVGLCANNARGVQGALFYLLAYTFMIMGSFAIVELVARRGERYTALGDYRGLFKTHPFVAWAFTFLLFAQAGIPGTSGFVAKFAVFSGAAAAEQWVLVVVGTLASVVTMFFYLRLVVIMYMDEPGSPAEGAGFVMLPTGNPEAEVAPIHLGLATRLELVLCIGFTLLLGILPQWALQMAQDSQLIF